MRIIFWGFLAGAIVGWAWAWRHGKITWLESVVSLVIVLILLAMLLPVYDRQSRIERIRKWKHEHPNSRRIFE